MLTPNPLAATGSVAAATLDALHNCMASASEAACIPPTCYVDDEHLKTEMSHIFQRKWVSVGRADRFKAAGDYETMDIGGVPVILVRDGNGILRAFANSCRHRGARLLDGEGNCRGIKCPFHGWAYKLDGRLAGAPHMETAEGFDRTENGLIEFRTGESLGFAFVCLDRDAPELADQLGDFAEFHAPWPLQELVSTRRRAVEVPCNWKAFLDVFNEYYHLAYIHPNTVAAMYGAPHEGAVTTGEFATQYGPISGSGGVLEDQQDHALPHIPGLKGEANTGVRYTWAFPNLTFAASPDALWMYETYPLGPHRCLAIQTVCFPRETMALDRFEEEAQFYYHRMDAALEEDVGALDNQQRGMASPFAQQGRFSPLFESSVAAFANWYARQFISNGAG
jgi:phenylpropionate dioxygenase-like ring-hydroxylating dioxygenase large terminal subunit